MTKKAAGPTKRKLPKSLTVYFNDNTIMLANEIERLSKEFNISVSNLCADMLWAGLPKVQAKLLHERIEREKLVTQQDADH